MFNFKKVNNVRVIPVSFKIVVVFSLFILISNLTTNFIGLSFNRIQQISLTKQLLIKDLKEISNYINIQWKIFQLNNDKKTVFENISKKSQFELTSQSSLFFGITPEGEVLFSSFSPDKNLLLAADSLQKMNADRIAKQEQDFFVANINNNEYFGIYKYNQKWDMFVFRGEEYSAFFEKSWYTFLKVIAVIFLIFVSMVVVGIYAVRYILQFIEQISESIMEMSKHQQLSIIPLDKAPNDDVTYMGMAFNSLANNVDQLIKVFKKFTDRDIVEKAYKEKNIKLEGEQKELTILFTDIKGYTNMTEVLGADIIKLLNLQYDETIKRIYKYNGTIGSIIGDALLAIYGVIPDEHEFNKSHAAILSAYELLEETQALQQEMIQRKEHLLSEKEEGLSEEEERIFQATMVDVGVGIDCGQVFYGTIGSSLRMTSTVIGDRVNAASRYEGLTRIYKVPVICSEFVKKDLDENEVEHDIHFVMIDRVQVKGKTEPVAIYWPVPSSQMTESLKSELTLFNQALQYYLEGDWIKAQQLFNKSTLPIADEFQNRTAQTCADNWKGVWVLTSK